MNLALFGSAVLLPLLVVPACAEAQGDAADVAARVEQLARAGQTVEAENVAAAYLKDHPTSVPVNVVMGELEVYRHAWPKAMQFYEAALQASPGDEHAIQGEQHAALALALHQRNSGDADAALQTLQHARDELPRDVTVLVSLAVQAQAMHRLKTALDAVNAALLVAPGNDRALYTAAGIHFENGESAIAAQQYRAFLQQHPDDATARFGLGRALRVQQRNEEARKELERSIALQPVQTEAYYQLGEIALESGQDAEARADYAKVLERMPDHGGALTGMGELLYRSHAYTGARGYLEKAVTASPEYQPAHYYLGLTLRRLGDAAGASRELGKATELAAKQQGKGAPAAEE